ncbi:epoxide hydrolase N-terminal domain-containing protein, partial [Streptomyces atroolivaceus]|uniref:epoxide hydrolase N-terminal domain-containing protein n=1 Tax=Streptomyces atroolivaceus TaxID=66869 RepID=UPI003F4E3164
MPDAQPHAPSRSSSGPLPRRSKTCARGCARPRWPDTPEDAGWSLGTDLDHLRELVTYWAESFDRPAREAALSALPRFRVPPGGLGIHFVRARATAPAGPVRPRGRLPGLPRPYTPRPREAGV